MSENSTDCLECRLTSGGGLVLSGVYLFYCGHNFQNFNRYFLFGLGPGLGILGLLRIFNLRPFDHSTDKLPESKDVVDQENYITGKLPSKFL